MRVAGAVLAGSALIGCGHDGAREVLSAPTTSTSTTIAERTPETVAPDYETQARTAVNSTLEQLRQNGLAQAAGTFLVAKDVCMSWNTHDGRTVVVAHYVQYRHQNDEERLWLNFAMARDAATGLNIPQEGTFTWGLMQKGGKNPRAETTVDTAHVPGETAYISARGPQAGQIVDFGNDAFLADGEFPALLTDDGQQVAVTFAGSRQGAQEFVDRYCSFPGMEIN